MRNGPRRKRLTMHDIVTLTKSLQGGEAFIVRGFNVLHENRETPPRICL
jgi:hypothetical protein